MNKYIIDISNTTRLVRINKRTARKMYDHNLPVMFCPVNLSPVNMYMPGTWQKKSAEDNFTSRVNSFEYYNCTGRETGYYTAFYAPYCMIDSFTGKRLPFDYNNTGYNLTYDTEYTAEV